MPLTPEQRRNRNPQKRSSDGGGYNPAEYQKLNYSPLMTTDLQTILLLQDIGRKLDRVIQLLEKK